MHIALYLPDAAELIVRRLEREGVFELLLPDCVGAEHISFRRLPGSGYFKELFRHVGDCLFRLCLGVSPLCPGKAVHLRLRRTGAYVFLYEVHLIGRNVENVLALVDDLKIILRFAIDSKLLEADELSDAVLFVDDVVSFGDVCKAFDRARFSLLFFAGSSLLSLSCLVYSEYVAVRDVAEHIIGQDHSLGKFAFLDPDPACEPLSCEELIHIVDSFVGRAYQRDLEARLQHALDLFREHVELAAEGYHLAAPYAPDLIVCPGACDRPGNGSSEDNILLLVQLQVVVSGREAVKIGLYDHLPFKEDFEVVHQLSRASPRIVVSPLRIVYHDERIIHVLPQILRLFVEIIYVIFQMLQIGKIRNGLKKRVPSLRQLCVLFCNEILRPGYSLFVLYEEARRHDVDRVQFFDGSLRIGVEMPQRFDLRIEEFSPYGQVVIRCEYVKYIASERELAFCVYHRHPLVSDVHQSFRYFRRIHLRSELQLFG